MVEMKNPIKEADANPDDQSSEFMENRSGIFLGDQLRGQTSGRHALP